MSMLEPPGACAQVRLCAVEDIPVGLGRAFRVGEQAIAVFRHRAGGVFAFENRCPHKAGVLSEGMLAGDRVVCPMHSFRFGLADGGCDQAGVCRIATFETEVRDGHVYVKLPA